MCIVGSKDLERGNIDGVLIELVCVYCHEVWFTHDVSIMGAYDLSTP